jgi:hypothetical protein
MPRKNLLAVFLVISALSMIPAGACAQASPDEKIRELNWIIGQQGLDWTAGETSVSGLSAERKESMLLDSKPETSDFGKDFASSQSYGLPVEVQDSLDWRNRSGNWVTPVRNQGGCGSCWAFAAVGVIESRVNIGLGNPSYGPDLSEQELVSCSKAGSCQGGQEGAAISYARSAGLVRESCFPYSAANLQCKRCASPDVVKVLGYTIASDLQRIREAVNIYGPVTVYMAVYEDFFYYTKGVYRHVSGALSGFHAVSIVGYNDTGSYWICKNSWGSRWGESGYFRINYSENVKSYYQWTSNRTGTFFLDESYAITSTDIDMDGVRDEADNCKYANNPGQEDLDNNSIGDYCDCMPYWIRQEAPCLQNDSRMVSYVDSNGCGKEYGLPPDSGSFERCDYCQPSFTCSSSSCVQEDRLKCTSVNDLRGCFSMTNSSSDLYSGNFSEFEPGTCDYCTPEWACSGYACQRNDTAYCTGLNDSRSCFSQTGLESDLSGIQGLPPVKCDFCTPNWTGRNASCQRTDKMTAHYEDANSCFSITGLPSDMAGKPANATHSCDYCIPNWTGVLGDCLQDESRAVWYNDSNSCHGMTGLSSDNQRPRNETRPYACDYDKDGLIGGPELINTTLKGLEVLKENSTVRMEAGNKTILEFVPGSPVNLADVFIEKQGSLSGFSYILIKGISLPENLTKAAYAERILNGTGVCIKDAEISSIQDISPDCRGKGEVWTPCPGAKDSYICEIVENDTRYKISGLRHTGIREQESYCGDLLCNGVENCTSCSADCGDCLPVCGDGLCNGNEACSSCQGDCGSCPAPPASPSSQPSGGGGGGYEKPKGCSENWSCSGWSGCFGGLQTRACTDFNRCGTLESRPDLTQACQVFQIPKILICSPRELSCSGQALMKCSEDGFSWNQVQECEYGCLDGACNPASQGHVSPETVEAESNLSAYLHSILFSIFMALLSLIF